MENISASDLLGMRSHAKEAENYVLACSAYVDRLTRAHVAMQVENVRLREALAELIACKNLKDAMRTTRSDPYYVTQADRMEAEYERRQPAAWDAARAALVGPNVEHEARP